MNHIPEPATEEVELMRTGGPLGLSIVGGIDHSSHPFGADEPGIFISKVSLPADLVEIYYNWINNFSIIA